MTPNRQSEIRAAAERLARTGDQYDYIYWDGNAKHDPEEDAKAVADAYLAEHPADDEQAIDHDYAEAALVDSELGLATRHGQLFAVVMEFQSIPLKTRGDLRRLASALGIELRNQQG